MSGHYALALVVTALSAGIGLFLWVTFEDQIKESVVITNKPEKGGGN